MARIEQISKGSHTCGEGPHWHQPSESLFHVDIVGQNVVRWDERRQTEVKLHIASEPKPASPISGYTTLVLPVHGEADTYVISRGNRLSTLVWDGCSSDFLVRDFLRVDDDLGFPMRFNDGKCDMEGTLWTGTMSEETSPGMPRPGAGSIYSISSADGSAIRRHQGVSISNGIAFSSDNSRMFYIDTCAMSVDVFDHDVTTKEISNRRVVYDVAARRTPGLPDGLCIDARGRLWVALFFGSAVACVDSATGQLAETLHLPATNITSCAWGDAGQLFVTSATAGLAEWQMRAQPAAGATFRVTGLGVGGGPGNVEWRADVDALPTL